MAPEILNDNATNCNESVISLTWQLEEAKKKGWEKDYIPSPKNFAILSSFYDFAEYVSKNNSTTMESALEFSGNMHLHSAREKIQALENELKGYRAQAKETTAKGAGLKASLAWECLSSIYFYAEILRGTPDYVSEGNMLFVLARDAERRIAQVFAQINALHPGIEVEVPDNGE